MVCSTSAPLFQCRGSTLVCQEVGPLSSSATPTRRVFSLPRCGSAELHSLSARERRAPGLRGLLSQRPGSRARQRRLKLGAPSFSVALQATLLHT